MKNISLKIPEALDYQLVELASRQNKNKSVLIREVLESFISSKRATSSLSGIKDLVGTLEGPKDLSYHKDHMENLGSK